MQSHILDPYNSHMKLMMLEEN